MYFFLIQINIIILQPYLIMSSNLQYNNRQQQQI